MFHAAVVMRLREGCLDSYRDAHRDLWPDVAAGLRSNNIDMAIYHCEGLLFVFVTAPSAKEWLQNRDDPALAAWNLKMAGLLQSDEEGNVLFVSPEQVFGFGQFA